MNPYRLPSAHTRVPIRNRLSGMTRADEESVPRRAQDGERGHVRAEERPEEHERPERSAGKEVPLRRVASPEVEDAHIQDDRQVNEDDERRGHGMSGVSRPL